MLASDIRRICARSSLIMQDYPSFTEARRALRCFSFVPIYESVLFGALHARLESNLHLKPASSTRSLPRTDLKAKSLQDIWLQTAIKCLERKAHTLTVECLENSRPTMPLVFVLFWAEMRSRLSHSNNPDCSNAIEVGLLVDRFDGSASRGGPRFQAATSKTCYEKW